MVIRARRSTGAHRLPVRLSARIVSMSGDDSRFGPPQDDQAFPPGSPAAAGTPGEPILPSGESGGVAPPGIERAVREQLVDGAHPAAEFLHDAATFEHAGIHEAGLPAKEE